MLIAKYNGRWNPDTNELIEVFGLKNKNALSTLTHRMPVYIEDIKKLDILILLILRRYEMIVSMVDH